MDSLILRLRHDAASATVVMRNTINVERWTWALVTQFNVVLGNRLERLRKTLLKVNASS
jgi:hypothetical protein